MGIFVEEGQVIERRCYACRETVRIVGGENQEVAHCPCCGYSLMEPCPDSIPSALQRLEHDLAAYAKGNLTKGSLQYALGNLDEALELSRCCTIVAGDEFEFVRKIDNPYGTKLYRFRGELFAIGHSALYKSKYQVCCTDARRRDCSSHATIKAAQQYIRDNFRFLV
jgi:hypothetical protein